MNTDGTRADKVNQGDIIHIFDADNPYEGDHDKACVKYLEEDIVNEKVRLDLAQITDCTTAYQLQYTYEVDDDLQGQDPWDFSSGKSAGVCVDDNQFYKADPTDLAQPFSDGFVTFHISSYGIDGSGVVPYLPGNVSIEYPYSGYLNKYRFQQIWFKNKNTSDPYLNDPSNYWHLIGASYSTVLGEAWSSTNSSFVFVGSIESNQYCHYIEPQPSGRDCTAVEKANHIRHTTSHEITHQFLVVDEGNWDWAWCGNPNPGQGKPAYTCGHPNGVYPPPNDNIDGEYCLISPRLEGQEDIGLGMRTDGVDKLDCCLLNGQVCHNEPGGRSGIREVEDPQ